MLATLDQVLPYAAERYATKTALTIGERGFSFIELNELSDRVAAGLAAQGIVEGDIVTLYSENRWEWIVSYYAVLKLGAVINPINVMLTPSEVEFVVTDCEAKALIASGPKGTPMLGMRESSDLKVIVLFDDDAVVDGVISFHDLADGPNGAFASPAIGPTDLSTICYTSGTTGHPKGAMQSHEAVLLSSAMTAQMHVRTEADTMVSALPCPHVYGNVIMNTTMMYGMHLVLHETFVVEDVLDSIERYRATTFDGVPTMYMYMLAHPDMDKTDLSTLTKCFVGGQTMPVAKMEEVEARFGCDFIELWGMTELAGLATTHPLYGPNKHGSIGMAVPYAELRIGDVDDATITMPNGEVGELMVRGPLVMLGYYGNETATNETIEADGWMHTGDLASMDADGCAFIVDRKKDMILTGGYNVYPAELERVIAAHPDVALVAVGPVVDENKGELAKAYIVLKDGVDGDVDSILAHCRDGLAAYKRPRQVQFVDALPTTSTGKVMRRELHTLDD
ncbi:MAG: class I adenylate-forming enzyme family protein [Acidimicrobiales bacterium]